VSSSTIRRSLIVLAAIGVFGVSSYAFMGSITGLETAGRAGATGDNVDGYAVSNLRYTHNAADPNKIDAVRFTLDGDAAMTNVRLVADGPWYDCVKDVPATAAEQARPGHKTWVVFTCNSRAPQATVRAQDEFSVVAQS
jgi:hypothetical protein